MILLAISAVSGALWLVVLMRARFGNDTRVERFLVRHFLFWLQKPRFFTINEKWAMNSRMQFGNYPSWVTTENWGWSLSILGIINGPMTFFHRVVVVEDYRRLAIYKDWW